jgi:hypothetical protein
MNMLKKAGIIAAVAATGVLTLSGLAFADTIDGNVGNDCAFGNANGDSDQSINGGSSLLGDVLSPLSGVIANITTQANTANCTNVQLKDLVDDNSNNDTTTVTERDIEDSFNRR